MSYAHRRHPRSRRSSAPAYPRPPPGCGRPPPRAARAARGAARRGAAARRSCSSPCPPIPSIRTHHQVDPQLVRRILEERPRQIGLRVQRQPHPGSELGVVFEQGVRPRRAPSVRIRRPRRRREVPPVDRGAAGSVRDQHPIAEQLGQHLEVGRLAASGARTRELEQRPELLGSLDRVGADLRAIGVGDRQEEVEGRSLLLEVSVLGLHVDRLVLHLAPCCAPGTRRRRSRTRCSRPAPPGSSCASPAALGTSTLCP